MNIANLLGVVSKAGINLSIENDEIKVKAAKGAVTEEIKQLLVANKPEILKHLKSFSESQALSIPAISKREQDNDLPLSFSQQRLWFVDQLEQGSTHFNSVHSVLLSGRWEKSAFERAYRALLLRHEVLRTHFVEVNKEPKQRIVEQFDVDIDYVDLKQLSAGESQNELVKIAKRLAQKPFDLTCDLMLRAVAVELSEQKQCIVLATHHIASDGWSKNVLEKELLALYQAEKEGREPSLPKIDIQYGDFAQWQRNWLSGDVLNLQLDYWKTQLKDIPVLHSLPVDGVRKPEKVGKAKYHQSHVNAELSSKIKLLCKQQDVTPFMLLHGAFSILIAQFSNEKDVVIGTAVAGRFCKELEPLIGFFVNDLVLRAKVDSDQKFIEFLSAHKRTVLDAYQYQYIPFDMLVETLNPNRSMSHNPLFQIKMDLHSHNAASEDEKGAQESAEIDHLTSEDLYLSVGDTTDGLSLKWMFNADLFDARTIASMASSFDALLSGICANIHTQIGQLALNSQQQQTALIQRGSLNSSALVEHSYIHELIEQHAEQSPDALAVTFENESISYRELNERANQLAHYLITVGVKPNSLVGICIERSIEMFVGILAILKAGGGYVPMDPSYPESRLSYILDDCDFDIILSEQNIISEIDFDGRKTIPLDGGMSDLLAANFSSQNPVPSELGLKSNHIAYAIYTSGSTGKPRAVLVSHSNLLSSTLARNVAYPTQPASFLLLSSYAFDSSVAGIFWTLTSGGNLVVGETTDGLEQEKYLGLINTNQVSHILTLPSVYSAILTYPCVGENSVKQVIVAGEVCPQTLPQSHYSNEYWKLAQLINEYGPTEGSVWTSFYDCVDFVENNRTGSVSIGGNAPHVSLYVLDEQMKLVPTGVVGELYIGGSGVAQGYLNQPELTAKQFMSNPFDNDADARLYKTGDLVRWNNDGLLEYVGRRDEQLKIRGYRVELSEIEAALLKLENVQSVAVAVAYLEGGEPRLVAYITLAESLSESAYREYRGEDELDFNLEQMQSALFLSYKAQLQDKLPDYMIPSIFMMMDQLPLLPNGKVDKHNLPEPQESDIHNEVYVAPQSETEQALCEIWQQVLKLKQVGIDDNFFMLGGHSLLGTKVISLIREQLGMEVPLKALFESPTVAQLSAYIDSHCDSTALPDIVPADRSQPLLLSYAQQRLWFIDKLGGGSPQYNVPKGYYVNETFNIAAFQKALTSLIERHESLRTNFITIEGEARQVIQDEFTLPLVMHDLSRDDEQASKRKLDDIIRKEAKAVFDLANDLLLRVRIVKLSKTSFVILYTMHHIASDGWSSSIVQNELNALYEAYCKGADNPLPPMPLQYIDYAMWQRSWLKGDVLDTQLAYWQEQLAGVPATHRLPLDNPRPKTQSYEGQYLIQRLTSHVAADIRTQCQQHQVTLFMFLQTAFAVLLGQYSNEDDIVVGAPIAGRDHEALNGLIGFFVNSLAIRTDLSGNLTFAELLERNKQVILDAYAHQHIPFELIVEKLRPERNLNHNPIFQVTFAVQNNEQGHMDKHDDSHSEESNSLPEALKPNIRNDIELHVIESDGELVIYWLYNDNLFAKKSIERMARSYDELLASVLQSLSVTEDHTPISSLNVVTHEQHQQALTDALERSSDESQPKCLHTMFAEQAQKTPSAIAVSCDGEEWTYKQVNARANKLARYLIEQGVEQGSLVPLCIERSVDMVVALLAVLKAGAAYVPVDPSIPAERLKAIYTDCDAKFILATDSSKSLSWSSAMSTVLLGSSEVEKALLNHPSEELAQLVPVGASDLAYVLYTSGSTGVPKGVMIEHRNVYNLAMNMHHWVMSYCGEHASSWALNAGMSFDASLQGISQMALGMELVILPQHLRMDAASLYEYLTNSDIDVFDCTPSQLKVLLEQGTGEQLPALVVGGEKLGEQLWSSLVVLNENYQVRSVNVYGPTEVCVNATWCNIDTTVPTEVLGQYLNNVYGYVIKADEEGTSLVPEGVVGELLIGGAGVARGYLNRDSLTRETFFDDPFNSSLGKVYRTGDLVRKNTDGQLEFVGRADNQVKIRGYRIELEEIEAKLDAHQDVSASVVIIDNKDPDNQQLVSYLEPTDAFLQRFSQATNSRDLEQWSEVFEEQYDEADAAEVADSNFVGWNSSYTGKPLDITQMQEWRDGTIEQIMALKPQHLLEVGCGMGLLLFNYAQHCRTVHATELSFGAMNAVQKELDRRQWKHVELSQGDALNTEAIKDKTFDTIVINSVAQYFPNPLYLEQVIEALLPHLEEGGKLLLGDLRNLDLYEPHLAMMEQCLLTKSVSADEMNRRIQRRMQQEPELLVSPSFFKRLEASHADIGNVDILAKRGFGDNEMMRYRYEAVITKGQANKAKTSQWHKFEDFECIKALLDKNTANSLGIFGIPNSRLREDISLYQELSNSKGAKLIHPNPQACDYDVNARNQIARLDEIIEYAAYLGYQAHLTWSQDNVACIDLIIAKDESVSIVAKSDYTAADLTNYPRLDVVSAELTQTLNASLSEQLPQYMVPQSYITLPKLPLTVSGKVNKRVLPKPLSSGVSEDELVKPSNEVEAKLCAIWQQLLHVEHVGVTDNFFSLGGHSLLATRLVSAIRATFNVELNLADVFASPTIAEIAPSLSSISEEDVLPQIHKVDREQTIPLSFAQQRLWFIDKLNHGSLEYVMSGCFAISVEVDQEAFKQALGALIDRHEILRTRFVSIAGEPSQIIETLYTLPFTFVDVSQLSNEQKQRNIQQLLDEEANTAFCLETDVMLRVVLVKLSDDMHLVVHSTHHIASDGWSMNIFKEELTKLYYSFKSNTSETLTPLPLQYAEYALWQRQWLQGNVLEKELSYWRKQLANLPVLHSLPLDNERPAQASYQGQLIEQNVDMQLSQNIKEMASKQNVTLFMFLESAFALLLGRLGQQDDIVFGSPISGRVHKDVEGLIGFFVNTLVLRHDLSGELTFSEVLSKNKQMLLDAYSNQHIPFEMLVEKLSPERLRNANPLFQVVFALQNQADTAISLEDASQTQATLGLDNIDSQRATRFDIELNAIDTELGIRLHWTYNTALFEQATIRQWSACFEELLALLCEELTLIQSAETPIKQLEIASLDKALEHSMCSDIAQTNSVLESKCASLQSLIRKHPMVLEAEVMVNETADSREEVVVFWQRDERVESQCSNELAEKELLKFIRTQPTLYTMPNAFVLLTSMPRNYHNEIDIVALRQLLEQDDDGDNYVAPSSEIEQKLCTLWQSILETDRIGVEDNFFAIGGHSLLATRITSAIKESLGVDLPISILFESPTIALLAKDIETRMNELVLPPIEKCDRSKAILPSYSQQRLWFIDQLGEDSVQYNVSGRLEMPLDLNIQAFKQALKKLIERHEVLRTTFALVDGEPQQVIHSDFDLPYEAIDLVDEALDVTDEKVKYLANEEATTPFDLNNDLMFRVRVLKLAQDNCVVLYTMHHIASDGWSIGIVNKEIHALYEAELTNTVATLPQLRVQFADFAMWQRQWLTGKLLEQQLSYWEEQLGGAPMVHGLPLDKARPARQSYDGHKFTQKFDKQMTTKIKALCEQHEVTMFMFMETVFAVLLARFGQNKDILIGSPMSGRNNQDLEPLIGFFVNSLVLRTDVSDNPTFSELLETNKRTILQGYAHQHTPFDMLVERIRPERNKNFNPVYQVSFTTQVGNRDLLDYSSSQDSLAEVFEIKKTSIRFDLMLNVKEVGEEMTLGWSYNSAIFNDDTIFSMASSMRHLVESVFTCLAKDPWDQEGVSQLPIVNNQSVTDISHSPSGAKVYLHKMFEQHVSGYAQSTALRLGDTELTYNDLNTKANRLAHKLLAQGVLPNDVVAVYMPQSLEALVSVLAILKAGAAYLHIDPQYPAERCQFMLQDCRSDIVLTCDASKALGASKEIEALTEQGALCIDVATIDIELSQFNSLNPDIDTKPDDIAYVIYTSGSTGYPKGVAVSHYAIAAYCEEALATFYLEELVGSKLTSSLGFDATIVSALFPLLAGGMVDIWNSQGDWGVFWQALIESQDGYLIKITPSHIQGLSLREQSKICNTAHCFVVGGEVFSLEALQCLKKAFPNASIFNQYGPTEAVVGSTFKALTHEQLTDEKSITIGRPFTNKAAIVLNQYGLLCPVGAVGVLHIGGEGLAQGYLNNSQLTAQRFIKNVYKDVAGERLYNTGDLVRQLPNGEFEFIGRLDNQVKLRGYRIELAEIEATILRHDAVQSCIVRLSQVHGEAQMVAYFIQNANFKGGINDTIAKALREYLQATLPEYMVPTAWIELDSLPLTVNGKVDIAQLPSPSANDLAVEEYVSAASDTEAQLIAIWSELLNIDADQIGTKDNFFALGGHSLLVMRMLAKLQQQDMHLQVSDVIGAPDLASLAAILDKNVQTNKFVLPENLIAEDCEKITPDMLPLIALSQSEIDHIVSSIDGGVHRVKDIYPLVSLQEGIYFHHMLEPLNDPYLESKVLLMDSREQVDMLLSGLQFLIDRHDIFRTAIVSEGVSQPVQVVYRHVQLPVETYSLNANVDTDEQLQALLSSSDPMDLSKAPMIRVKLAKDPQSANWFFILQYHHLISDNESAAIMAAELSAFASGSQASLTPSVPYRNFVAHTLYLNDQSRAEQYFTSILSDVTEPTLPFNLGDVRTGSRKVDLIRKPLEPGLARSIRICAKELKISPAVIFHTAWAWVVGTCSNRSDVVFGTVLSGRMQSAQGVDGALGMFINTLPLRVQLSEGSIKDIVLKTDLALKELLDYEQTPLSVAQQCSGIESGRPLFSSLFNYRHGGNTAKKVSKETKLGVRTLSAEDRTNFPFVLSVNDMNDGFVFDAQIDQSASGERVVSYMERALSNIVDTLKLSSGLRMNDVSLLNDGEQHQQLVEWSGPEVDYGDENVHTLFEICASQRPNAAALILDQSVVSYSQLNELSNRRAAYLLDTLTCDSLVIGLYNQNRAELIINMLAVLKAGGAYVPLSTGSPAKFIGYIINDSDMDAVLIDSEQQSFVEEAIEFSENKPRIIQMDRVNIESYSTQNQNIASTPNNLAYIMYTSGTTGRPKGTLIPHRGITSLVNQADYVTISEQDVFIQLANPAFDAATFEIWGALTQKAALVIPSNEIEFDAESIAALLTKYQVSILWLTRALFDSLYIQQSNMFADLRYLLVGGEALTPMIINRLIEQEHRPEFIINGYGPTECTTFTTTHLCSTKNTTIPIGKPINGRKVYVLSEQQTLLPVGAIGELYIGGAGLALGYLKQEELTSERFVANPFADNNSSPKSITKLYRTGDRVRWSVDGELEYLGRNDCQVKIHGYRIELGEVENALIELPVVDNAVVTSITLGHSQPQLVAYIVDSLFEEKDEKNELIKSGLQSVLPGYMIPDVYIYVDEIPLTVNGKVDYKALPNVSYENINYTRYVAPRNEIEDFLCRQWSALLNIEKVGISDNFYALGGHSLVATRLLSAIRHELCVELPMKILLETPTIAELSEIISANNYSTAVSSVADAFDIESDIEEVDL